MLLGMSYGYVTLAMVTDRLDWSASSSHVGANLLQWPHLVTSKEQIAACTTKLRLSHAMYTYVHLSVMLHTYTFTTTSA